jgi:hypothetical protein
MAMYSERSWADPGLQVKATSYLNVFIADNCRGAASRGAAVKFSLSAAVMVFAGQQ